MIVPIQEWKPEPWIEDIAIRWKHLIEGHMLSDTVGRPAVVRLDPGDSSDVRTAPALLAAAPGRIGRLLADEGCDADGLRLDPREAGIMPVV